MRIPRTEATKQLSFQELPAILVLSLQRFSYVGGKDDRHITFDDRLDMTPCLSDAAVRRVGDNSYDLYAVLVHVGQTEYGGMWSAHFQYAHSMARYQGDH